MEGSYSDVSNRIAIAPNFSEEPLLITIMHESVHAWNHHNAVGKFKKSAKDMIKR